MKAKNETAMTVHQGAVGHITYKACGPVGIILSAMIALLGFTHMGASASAPRAKDQAPGFYRLTVGDFEVTALLDGTRTISAKAGMRDIDDAETENLLEHARERDDVMTSFNAFLVNTGKDLILVDTGAGSMFGEGLGHMKSNLIASGYRPDQVDDVLLTHLHVDHIGGLVSNGKRVFPNATVRVNRVESDFWLSEENMRGAPPALLPFFNDALEATGPYIANGRFEPFEQGTEVLPGIRALPAPGHTPGHTVYVIESKGKKLLLWGDISHMEAIEFSRPETTFRADIDPKQGVHSRNEFFELAARKGILVGGAHLPFPGIGHVRQGSGGDAFEWLPIGYGTVP